MNTVNATERKLQDVLDVSYRDKNPLRTLWVLFHGRRPQLLLVAVLYCIKSSPMSVLPIVSEPRLAEAKILRGRESFQRLSTPDTVSDESELRA